MRFALDMCSALDMPAGERSYIISKREALYRICKANISILRSKNIDEENLQ